MPTIACARRILSSRLRIREILLSTGGGDIGGAVAAREAEVIRLGIRPGPLLFLATAIGLGLAGRLGLLIAGSKLLLVVGGEQWRVVYRAGLLPCFIPWGSFSFSPFGRLSLASLSA